MSNVPPPIPSVPPVIPPPIPPPRKKPGIPLWAKITFALVAVVCGFFVFRLVQFGLYLKDNPFPKTPGEAEFREANRQIIANHGTVAFGNNPEAVALAADYARSLKVLRESFFSEGKKGGYSIAKGEFLTYCQRSGDACVFLVHVPELRRFTRDAKDSLVELAWRNAQYNLKDASTPPAKTVVVGVKGTMLYEAILIGDFVPDLKTEAEGVKTRASGMEGMKLLYPFFATAEKSAPVAAEVTPSSARTEQLTPSGK